MDKVLGAPGEQYADASMGAAPAQSLDERGRCCGRKPIPYKRPLRYFCPRCDRRYGPDGLQQSNWAWTAQFGDAAHFVPTYPAQAYARIRRAHKGVAAQVEREGSREADHD